MTFDDFKFVCYMAHEINPDILESYRNFVEREFRIWHIDGRSKITQTATFDFGFAELDDVVNQEQSIVLIKNMIGSSIIDYDRLGRSLRTKKIKQLIKYPHKTLGRYILKAYYLHSLGLNAEWTPDTTSIQHTLNTLWQDGGLLIEKAA